MPAPNDLPPAATAPQAIGGDVEVLRRLVEGTVRSTGEEFFRSLVRNLSLALGSPYALVAEFAGSPSRVRTLAYWGKGAFLDDIEYDLAGTPCEDVARGELCHHPDSVQQRFPNDRPLAAMGIESYIGVPLFDGQREVLGHLAVFDTAPTRDVERGISILQPLPAGGNGVYMVPLSMVWPWSSRRPRPGRPAAALTAPELVPATQKSAASLGSD